MGEFIINLEQFLITYSPNIISIIGMIATFVVAIRKFKTNSEGVEETRKALRTDYDGFRAQLKKDLREQTALTNQLLTQNLELKEQNLELKEALTRIKSPTVKESAGREVRHEDRKH